MKTILVPTDFSENAENVVAYAAQLAKAIEAKIILFHVYHPPVTISELPDVQPMEQIEVGCVENLENVAGKLRVRYGHELQIECKAQCGFAVDEIKFFQENNAVDLIVMGMRGAGYLSERLIGSITTSLIYKSSCPVLAIAENVVFRPIRKIAFACDFATASHAELGLLKEIAGLFQAHIYMLNVVPRAEKMLDVHESPAGIELEQELEGTEHSIHYSQNSDIVDGINEFVHAKGMDLVVMVPKTHSFWENITHEPNTKKMAFHSDVPLLALHTKEA